MQSKPANLRVRAGWMFLLVLSILLSRGTADRSVALSLSQAETLGAILGKSPTLPDPPLLLAPSDGSSTCGATLRFTWSRVKKATWYQIQVDDSPAFDSPVIDQVTTDTSHTPDSGLPNGTYHWRVRASKDDVTGTWSGAWNVTILSPPADPTLLSPLDGSRTCDTTPTMQWSPVVGATSYRVQVDDDPSFRSPATDEITSNPEYTPKRALTPGTYSWRVQAENACGGGLWSPVFTLTILSTPSAPDLLAPKKDSSTYDRTPTFIWKSMDEVPSYRIQVDDSESFDSPTIDETTASASYTPTNALANGTHHWRVLASSTCGSSDWSERWSITIDNQVPTANDDRFTVDEDSVSNLLDVLANDGDLNGDRLRIVTTTQPARGSVEIVNSGTRLTYRPDPDYFGQDSLSYTVDDGNGGTNAARADITVTGINDPPVTQSDSVLTDEDTPATIDVLENDVDIDGRLDPSTVQRISGPEHGSTSIDTTNGEITYAPDLNWNGSDRFTYRVCDDGTPLPAQCGTATVDVAVRAVNDPPVADAGPDQTVKTSALVTLDGSGSYDPDGDLSLKYFWTQYDGPPVILSNAAIPSPTFIAPHEPCVLTFKLFVIDSLDEPNRAPDQVVITVHKPPVFRAYLPLSAHRHVVAPDLIVQSITATSNNVRLTIVNQGNAPVSSPFFVDAYIDPRSAPTAVNQTWDQLGSQGLVWAVIGDVLSRLVPGGSLTLDINDAHYVADLSSFSGSLPTGTVVYAQVDSFNLETTYGNVLETHEMTDGPYNNIRGPVHSTAAVSGDPRAIERLDDREPLSPARTVP